MNRNFRIFLPAALAALMITACGGKSATEAPAEVEEAISSQESTLADAMNSGNIRRAATIADSLALMVDDLTPSQTVSVLATFVGVVNNAEAEHRSRVALETMRKYVDVYDIGLSINPKDLRSALESDGRYRYDSLATAYRGRLADVATLGVEDAPAAPKSESTDSLATDSINGK